jgi:hypothetical protein
VILKYKIKECALILIVFCGLFLVGCLASNGSVTKIDTIDGSDNFRYPYLNAIDAPDEIKAGDPLELTIHASLPDPSWSYVRMDYKVTKHNEKALGEGLPAIVNEEKHLNISSPPNTDAIEVFPWIKQQADAPPTIMVLVDFTQTLRITDLDEGDYLITVHGEGKNLEKRIIVNKNEKPD